MKYHHIVFHSPARGSLLFLTLLFWLFTSADHCAAEMIDRVVAEVNDDVITLSELESEGAAFFRKIIAEVPPADREKALENAREQVLDGLIDKTLIAQEAAARGVTVSEEEIDATIEQMIAENKSTREAFYDNLRDNDLDVDTYRENLRSQLYQNKLVTRDVRSKIVITENQILDYYDTKYTRHVDEGGYYLLQIGTSWGESESSRNSSAALYEDKLAARKRIAHVHKLALSGQEFRALARKYSDLPSAADGGDIGVFQEEDMAAYMKDAVLSLGPGDVSKIIETPAGFQFFKLLSSREGGIVMQAPYETVKDEIRERLFREALQKEFNDWINNIRNRAYIRKL